MTAGLSPPSDDRPVIPIRRLDAVIFDMDGVVTDTARTHAAAWKRMFDEYLEERARRSGEPFTPFDEQLDYPPYLDGKNRYDGARSFLESRGIDLPLGEPEDPPAVETVCGLANRKDGYFAAQLRQGGAKAYGSTVRLIRELRAAGVSTAIISASQHMEEVLRAAGVFELFDQRVGGLTAAELGLEGKPAPAIFLEAARRLGVSPRRAAVVEDALAGVTAGRRGGFGLGIGVDRVGQAEALRKAGADLVVKDLEDLRLEAGSFPSRSNPALNVSGPDPA
jgi:beta-phosphoglucomutase family hydrolase